MNHIMRKLVCLTLFILDTSLTGSLTNSEDQDEMQHKATFHQGLHCLLLRSKQYSGTEIRHFIKKLIGSTLKYKMDYSILVV